MDLICYTKWFMAFISSPAHLTELALPHLKKTKGNVINVSSVSSMRPYVGLMYYGALKSAMDHLTRVQAQLHGPDGIRFNTVK